MPKINFAKMFDPEAAVSPAASKQKMALANALMGGETPAAITSNGAAAAHIASKAFGGFLAGQADREEKEAGDAAWADFSSSPLVKGLMGGNTAGGVPLPPQASAPNATGQESVSPAHDASAPTFASVEGTSPSGGIGKVKSPYELARTQVGLQEVPNRAALQDYLKTGGVNLDPATLAWCAAFVNSSLAQAGVKGTGSNMARSFLNFGEAVDQPQKGDIAVFSRGDPTGPYGHVGFFDGYAPDGRINILGGNQGDAVSVAPYDPKALLGFRRIPSSVKVASADPNFGSQGAEPAATSAPAQVAEAGPPPQALAQGLEGSAPSMPHGLPPEMQETARQLLELGKNPRNRPFVMQQMSAVQQQAQELQRQHQQRTFGQAKVADQRAHDERVRQQGWQRDDTIRAETWKREDINKQAEFDRGQTAYTPDQKEYYNTYVPQELAAGRTPIDFTPWVQGNKKAGAINVTRNAGGGEAFYNKLDGEAATMFAELDKEGYRAQAKAGQIDRLEALLSAAQENPLPALRQLAGEYGIKTQGLDDIQSAQALINELVPQQRPAGSGTMSDADLALFKQSLPRMINQPGGNQLIIQTMRGINQYTMEQGAIARSVANRDLSPKEGRERLAALKNPLSEFAKTARENRASSKEPQAPAKAEVPQDAPQPGAELDGYRFKGGNPADQNSWEKVQ